MIRYPNGKVYERKETAKRTTPQTNASFANRGQTLEQQLNDTNEYYLAQRIAVIHKKPVPIQVVNVHYPARSAARITEAYFKTPSTTDFNGIWNGHYIDFEAKETKNKTSFPLANIHSHQVEHMAHVHEQKGIVFFVLKFTTLGRYFILPFDEFEPFWNRMLQGGRKSLTLAEVERVSYEMKEGLFPPLDYVQVIRQWMSESKER